MTRPAGLPAWLYIPAVVGVVFVGLPLVAMAARVDWPNFAGLISSPASRAALLLSLRTAAASTALCLILGVPLALVLARGDGRLTRLVRPLI
ncbi:MAG: molybdate ABC transporter permease subunit, partial [Mycobacterium sp.]